MRHRFQFGMLAILVSTLAACASTGPRTEHLYVFGKTPGSNNSIPNVMAPSMAGGTGPEHVAHIVYFDYDKYDVRNQDRTILQSHARWLKQNPQRRLVLRGHTDDRGGTEYNVALGQKRAQSVRDALEILGVPASRIDAVSYGKERLADTGHSEQAHQRNRRVEFDYP